MMVVRELVRHTIFRDYRAFHNKMEIISRQACGFRNFQNYRLRVKVLSC